DTARALSHVRVADAAQAAADAEYPHPHAQARQGLAQLEPDDAGTEHSDAARQVLPGEHIVVDYHAVAQRRERGGHRRPRAGGNHHIAGLDLEGVIHTQHRVGYEAGVTGDLVLGRDVFDALQDETDKAVA